MEKIKAIFCDFDWTLFDHNTKMITNSTVEALNKAKNNGVKLFINSARSFYSLDNLNLFKLINFDGYIVSNGGAAFSKDKVFYEDALNGEQAGKIISYLSSKNYSYVLITRESAYINVKNKDYVQAFYGVFYEPYPKDISKYQGEKILSIQVFESDEIDIDLRRVEPNLTYYRFFDFAIEITGRPFIKSKGVEAIFEEYRLNKNNCMAFGDDINDISMFNSVKYGICMGNGKDSAKNEAYYVTDDIDKDGIKKALEYFEVI